MNFKVLLIIFTPIFNHIGFCQLEAPRLINKNDIKQNIDSLRNQLSANKIFYEKYEVATLAALSYYPELINTSITFKRKRLKSTMAARPNGVQVFRSKGKRHYLVLINDYPSANISPDSVSFNALVGVIGHELAHIVEYETMSSLKLLYSGAAYFNKKFKARFEKATDQRTIEHGLLWQCYDFAVYVHSNKYVPKEYLDKKKKYYLGPEEIKKQVN